MKVLLSAYACEPNKGSEPGVGWNWAIEVEKLGHQVWVLTRKNNQSVIEEYFKNQRKPYRLQFIYYDIPRYLSWWKKGGRGVHLYYLLWQLGAYFFAKKYHKDIHFDRVQHITFVTVRQPSFMGLLGIPFFFGPVGGGERVPFSLRKGFGIKGWLIDAARDMVNFLVKFDPLMHITFIKAKKIYSTSEETKRLIPCFYRNKVSIQLAIGYDISRPSFPSKVSHGSTGKIKILYVGRFEYWKGMGFGLQAFSRVIKKIPTVELTMVGKGPDEQRWRFQADQLGVADRITWITWLEQKQLDEIYLNHDVFLFPSLHDSGGMVVLEAMAHGLPVVCADVGGPSVIVDDHCGIKAEISDLVRNLEVALIKLLDDASLRYKLGTGAVERMRAYSWSQVIKPVYD